MDTNQSSSPNPSNIEGAAAKTVGSGSPGFSGPHQEGGNGIYDHYTDSDAPFQNVSNFERAISIGVGAMLVYSAINNFRRTPVRAIFRAGLGAAMVIRGASGNCPIYSSLHVDGTKTSSVNMRTTMIINRPRSEVYAAWRNLSSFPKFMTHLKNVTETSATQSHWEAKIPLASPVSISWDAEIIKDEPNSLLSWRSLPGSTIDNAGKVEFRDALGNQGTEVKVTIVYRPPAGNIGTGVARLLNPVFRKMVKEDVLGFKQYFELQRTSEIIASR